MTETVNTRIPEVGHGSCWKREGLGRFEGYRLAAALGPHFSLGRPQRM